VFQPCDGESGLYATVGRSKPAVPPPRAWRQRGRYMRSRTNATSSTCMVLLAHLAFASREYRPDSCLPDARKCCHNSTFASQRRPEPTAHDDPGIEHFRTQQDTLAPIVPSCLRQAARRYDDGPQPTLSTAYSGWPISLARRLGPSGSACCAPRPTFFVPRATFLSIFALTRSTPLSVVVGF
jgi:hypothetical protein